MRPTHVMVAVHIGPEPNDFHPWPMPIEDFAKLFTYGVVTDGRTYERNEIRVVPPNESEEPK